MRDAQGVASCRQNCRSDNDCRGQAGYTCVLQNPGIQACVEARFVEAPEAIELSALEGLLGVRCDAEPTDAQSPDFGFPVYTLQAEVPATATSIALVPFASSGRVQVIELTTDEGTLDVLGDYRHQNLQLLDSSAWDYDVTVGYDLATYASINSTWPLVLPYAPQYDDYLVPGSTVTMRVGSSDVAPCLYTLSGAADRRTLDLNFYFARTNVLTAAYAPTSQDFAEVLATVASIYETIGVDLGTVRYFDLPEEVAEDYAMIRDYDDLYKLTSVGRPPGPTLEDNLSVDIFIVDTIVFGGGAILGVSGGLPGQPGMHGNPGNGLVFSVADIGSHNEHTGHVLAHELGHFLGLRHTTEVVRGSGTPDEMLFDLVASAEDPFDDTVVCEDIITQVFDCPDASNLMFPAAPNVNTDFVRPLLSPSQGDFLARNPLLR